MNDLNPKTDNARAQIPHMDEEALENLTWYLTRGFLEQGACSEQPVPLVPGDLKLFRAGRFTRIRFRKPADIVRGLQTFLDTINLFHLPFLYAVNMHQGECQILFGLWGTSFRFGDSTLADCFETMFESLRGFFPGCEASRIQGALQQSTSAVANAKFMPVSKTKDDWWAFLGRLPYRRAITGIPSSKLSSEMKNKPEQTELGLEELVDAAPDTFALVIYAEPLNAAQKEDVLERTMTAHDYIHKHAKVSVQQSQTEQASSTDTWSSSQSQQDSLSKGTSRSTSQAEQSGLLSRTERNIAAFFSGGPKPYIQNSKQETQQATQTHGTSETTGGSETLGSSSSQSATVERTSKKAAYLEELLNKMHKRLTSGSGLWRSFTEIYADSNSQADKIAHLLCGMLSGEDSRLDPMRATELPSSVNHFNYTHICLCRDHPLGSPFESVSTVLTTLELAMLTRLPLHDVPGIEVEKLAEYGRNLYVPQEAAQSVSLGNLVDRENETRQAVTLSPEHLLRHAFVSGATGSGKSNTMRHLLTQLWQMHSIPFLVIEPIKREYRELQTALGEKLQVFTPGDVKTQFRLNPFDFDLEVGLIPHIDLLKAAFNASLGMYSSMPFILEHVMYQAYERRGWNLESGANPHLERAAAQLGVSPNSALKSLFLPRMSDLPLLVDDAITQFFPSATDYSGSLVGALKARLGSLTKGAKGALLNHRHSTPFETLLASPCVLELWPFTDNEEKSFVMALILMRLYEYRQAQELRLGARDTNPLKHLLVVEEAHRLLAKPIGSGEHSTQGKQKGVEVFADILAEIRSYGQGIVIVDQIPSKLIPDVLRNTDIKIAHRLVDKEDRQVLGATMNLDEDQITDVARFSPGQACVYYSGLRKPLRVKIADSPLPDPTQRKTFSPPPNDADWQEAGIFGPLAQISAAPLPPQGVCARWGVCLLLHAMLHSTAMFEGVRPVALERLPQLTGATDLLAAQAGVLRALPLIGEWMHEFYAVPMPTALSLVCDAATLFKRWFAHEPMNEALERVRQANLFLNIRQVVEGKRQPDLVHVLMGLFLNEDRIRNSFQYTVADAVKQFTEHNTLDSVLTVLSAQAQGCVLGLPTTEKAARELMLRLLLLYHTEDQRSIECIARVYNTLKSLY